MEKMKTKQTKIDRSAAKWLTGAMALAATTASSQAATVQITLTGNKISTTGGNQLNADLTGDTASDVSFTSTNVRPALAFVSVWVGGEYVSAARAPDGVYFVRAAFGEGNVGLSAFTGPIPTEARSLNAITFTDSRVNGGVATQGWMEVWAYNTSATDHTVELTRLIFDDASTTRPAFASIPGAQTEWGAVPEPSSLGLLALGAGGLLLRRSRAKAAA